MALGKKLKEKLLRFTVYLLELFALRVSLFCSHDMTVFFPSKTNPKQFRRIFMFC